jgi:ketosteroid isomerase-like protein
MRAATLTIEPVQGALRLRLERPDRDAAALVPELRRAIDPATLAALEASAAALVRGGERASFPSEAQAVGTTLFRTLVPDALRDELHGLRTPLVVASSLALPWELVHDGHEFWGLRHPLGTRLLLDRPVTTREPAVRRDRPRALVVGANPRGDLPFVAREIETVCDALEGRADVVCVTDRLATLERVLAHLGEGFDVVHFCGHVVAAPDGAPALLLAGEQLLPAAVIQANLVGRPLVFVNGCGSATGPSSLPSVAHAFLESGALAVVGTIADVGDAHAATLAETFYREALGGAPLGNALREARIQAREAAPASPVWLSFVLYGDPAQSFVRGETPKIVPIRRPEPSADVTLALPGPARAGRWPWAIAALLLVLLAAWALQGRGRGPAGPVTVGVMEVRARGTGVPDWMRTLTRDGLNTVLARVARVQVYSRQKIDFLREKRGLTEIEAAEALGMTKLLSASVAVDGPQVSLDLEVVDIKSGVLEDTARVQGPQEKLLDLETELALRALTALGVQPSESELRAIVEERRDATVDAYRLLTETLGGGGKAARPPTPASTTLPPGPGTSWLEIGAPAFAQAPAPEESAIHELLRRYAAALEAKSADGLAALQVSMDDAQRASLARYFGIAEGLRVTVRDLDVLVEGDDAVVTFTREDNFTDAPSRRAMHLEVRVSGRLVKQAGAWRIKHFGDPS